MELTDRQLSELEYHRTKALEYEHHLTRPFNYDSMTSGLRRWWNAHWEMYWALKPNVAGKRVLVVGCGWGDDALRIAKAGGEVYGFDLSPESLSVGRRMAQREGLRINFDEMPAEKLGYSDGFFDVLVIRDIMHHVDIPATMRELVRVSKPDALWAMNEIYSHSITELVRRSWLVERFFYPILQRFVYQSKTPYITPQERKMTEADVAQVVAPLNIMQRKFFCFIVQRVIPDRWTLLNKLDRLVLSLLGGVGKYLAGRILVVGRLRS